MVKKNRGTAGGRPHRNGQASAPNGTVSAVDDAPADVEEKLADLASRIKDFHSMAEGFKRSAYEFARLAGELLIEVKTLVGHGNFETWLAANVDFSARTARVYMQVAEEPETDLCLEVANRQDPAVLTIDGFLKRRPKPRGAPRPAAPPGDGARKRAPAEPVPGDRRRPDDEREDPSEEDDEDEPPTDQTKPPVVTNGAAPRHDTPPKPSAVERYIDGSELIAGAVDEVCELISQGPGQKVLDRIERHCRNTSNCGVKIRDALKLAAQTRL
jgi:hypothetical protein